MTQKKITTVAIATAIFIHTMFAVGLFGMTPAVQTIDPPKCLLGQGFWKTHPEAWPVTSLTIGGSTYTEAQLLAILATPVRGNAALILSDQLIAALLDIFSGSTPTAVEVTISDAQSLLAGVNLLSPAAVKPSSSSGQSMISDADVLDAYNSGALATVSCTTSAMTGTASLGAAIAGANVTLTDTSGRTVSGTTASDGTFTLNTTAFTPPFLIRVVTASPSGGFPAGTTLFSVSADGNVSTNINVHVLSDLMLRSFYSAQGIDVDNAFANPIGVNAPPTPTAVQSLASLVIPAVQLWLNSAGVNATPGQPSTDSVNLISSPFTAYPAGVTPTSGLDVVLHLITSETIDPGNVTDVTIANSPITEAIAPTYPGGDVMTLKTTTTNGVTGVSSSESFTGLVITGANQAVAGGIDAQLAVFASIVNTNGSALTGAELLPIFAPDYLNDGLNATQDSNAFVAEVAGITFNSLQVQTIKNLDSTTNVADVIAAFAITQSGQSQSGTLEFLFKNEGGTWLMYGDQQIAFVNAVAESRTSQGGHSLGLGATILPSGALWQTDIFAGTTAPTSYGVTKVTVSGAGTIWFGASSQTLTHGATKIENGQTFDKFFGLSRNLGASVLSLTDTSFTFNLTAAGSGNPQYTVKSNAAATTEVVQFLGISNVQGSGPLSSILGQTITYNWHLPTTYPIGDVSVIVQISDGPGNNPATLTCTIGPAAPLGATSTSASISFPTNMSACGLSASDTIKQVSVFVEVDGVRGEVNIVDLSYPY